MAILSDASVVIDPPAPPSPPYGIFNAALGPLDLPDLRAEVAGIEYQPDNCGIARLWGSACEAVTSKVFDEGVDTLDADPFVVYSSWLCGSIGYTETEIRRRMLVRLALQEQRAVEQRIWQGNTGLGITGLFRAADVTTLTAASCPRSAVAALEQALADSGVSGGIIHARPYMVPWLANNHLVERPSARLLTTPLGTPYSFGQGYDGTGPGGQAVTSTVEYMYATGRVVIWRGEPIVPTIRQTLNRATNQQYAIAERPYMATVECGIWAVAVTRECTGS